MLVGKESSCIQSALLTYTCSQELTRCCSWFRATGWICFILRVASRLQDSTLHGHATRPQRSSALRPPHEHWGVSFPLQCSNCYISNSLFLSLSFFLFFFFGQITQAAVYKCPITQMLYDRKPISSRFVTPYSPVSDRREPCVPVFPQASSLVPSSPPRKFSFCWHQCGCCNCS